MNALVESFGSTLHMVLLRVGKTAWRSLVFLWKYWFGAILCLSLPGSVVALGWVYRATRRTVLKRWRLHSRFAATDDSFRAFCDRLELSEYRRAPNWLVRQNAASCLRDRWSGEPSLWRRALTLPGTAIHSLKANIVIGARALFTTWTLTLPGCALWYAGWHHGWNNSFAKGYEETYVGALTAALGSALFIAAMIYVPMAQARQAATGEWRAFYQFRVNWRLIRERWLVAILFAALFSVMTLPTMILKSAPLIFAGVDFGWAELSDAEALERINTYFFWSCLIVFAVVLALRIVAGRVYAGSLLRALESGTATRGDLTAQEIEDLERFDLLPRAEALGKEPVVRKVGRRAATVGGVGLLVAIWFSVVAQVLVTEFLNYHKAVGWMNQPTVQAPWFNYTPKRLKR